MRIDPMPDLVPVANPVYVDAFPCVAAPLVGIHMSMDVDDADDDDDFDDEDPLAEPTVPTAPDFDDFEDFDEDDFDDEFDDDFEEELEDDYEIEIDDELSNFDKKDPLDTDDLDEDDCVT
jgi:hypothetical protein